MMDKGVQCEWCGQEIPRRRKRFCSEAHRRLASEMRQARREDERRLEQWKAWAAIG